MRLEDQLQHLDNALLSQVVTQFPALLSDEEKALTHAYLVLSHAVLEEYIESVFKEHYRKLAYWMTSSTSMVPLDVARAAYAISSWLPEAHRVAYKKRSLGPLMVSAQRHFDAEVAKNHGITPDNIRKLAELTGLHWVHFEDALNAELADLKTLGAKRGEAGHLSPYTEHAVSLSRTDYPDDVRSWVLAGSDAARAIDKYVAQILGDQQPKSIVVDWDGN